jgi:hypothetical protein
MPGASASGHVEMRTFVREWPGKNEDIGGAAEFGRAAKPIRTKCPKGGAPQRLFKAGAACVNQEPMTLQLPVTPTR